MTVIRATTKYPCETWVLNKVEQEKVQMSKERC